MAGIEDSDLLEQPTEQSISVPVMNNSWFGKPVEEVDPMIFDETFCVISQKFDRQYIYRYSCSRSLFLFGPLNPIRRFAIYLTTHRWFDIIIILTILCNCITLAMITNEFDPQTNEKITPEYEEYVDCVEFVFLGVYLLELTLKVLAKGLVFNRFSYLRNRWNILDFMVVASGVITLIMDSQDNDPEKKENELEFLRTFRVLRVFKTITILPGLRVMINALLSAVVQLLEVMALSIVCLMIFSLFALEILQGKLRQKCVMDKGGSQDSYNLRPIADEPVEERDRIWTEWVNNWENWQRRDFPNDEPVFCGNGSDKRTCQEGYTCIGDVGDNPDSGWTSFDRFHYSMLSTFQLLTLDYWERLYDIVLSTCGLWSLLFFLLVIFLGSYYLINLMLAVVAMSYENSASAQDVGSISAAEKLAMHRRHSNFSFNDLAKINVCKMTHYKKRTKSERERLVRRLTLNELGPNDIRSVKSQPPNVGHLDDAIFSLLGMRTALTPENELALGDDELYSADDDADIQLPSEGSVQLLKKGDAQTLSGQSNVDFSSKSLASSRSIPWYHKLSDCCSKYFRPIVTHWFFDIFITVCIMANTMVLAIDHHGADEQLEFALATCNHIFMAIFTLECVLKLIALQKEYFQSRWNVFDLIVVLVNFLELAIEKLTDVRSKGLGVIRSMRLLRVFKLAHSWVTMKVLLNIIFASFGALGNLICVLLIVIYIFAVMGMQVVGGHYKPSAFDAVQNPNNFPVWHWRHFWYAFMMVFRILCGEWVEPLWQCLQAQEYHVNIQYGDDAGKSHHFLPYLKCMVLYLMILVVGNFIVLNLFLALLLNSFDTEELNAQRERELEAKGKTEELKNIVGLLMHTTATTEGQPPSGSVENIGQTQSSYHSKITVVQDDEGKYDKKPPVSKENEVKTFQKTAFGRVKIAGKRRFIKVVKRVILEIRLHLAKVAITRMENHRKRQITVPMANKLLLGNPATKGSQEGYHEDKTPEYSDTSEEIAMAGDCFPHDVCTCRCCPCKSRASSARRRSTIGSQRWGGCRDVCVKIVRHPVFEYTILFLIFASSITLCFEDIHIDQKPRLRQVLCYVNYGFTAVFCVEMILKWFAIGIWGYFTNFWTVLDAFIVTVSLISLGFDIEYETCSSSSTRSGAAAKVGALKALRTLRALRPLRAISRWEGMKIVVNSLVHAIPSIFNVLLVCLLFWLIFAIMGVQFFKGQFFHCVDEEGGRVSATIVPNKEVCCARTMTDRFSWINTISNYDNVLESYLSLLQIATFEGWIELMESSIDAVGVDQQPVTDSQIGYYAFYVIFIVFGAFFSLRLFIGVIIDNFNMLKKKYEGNMLEMLLTPNQRNYYIAIKNVGKLKPKPIIARPKNIYLGFFYDIATSRRLEVFIFLMIFLNMVVEAFQSQDMTKFTDDMIDGFGVFFTTVYFLEALIKIIGLGSLYFTVPWHVYDFILVGASVLNAFISLAIVLPIQPTMLRIVRIVRIGRILRLVKAAKGIRKLLFSLVISLPALFNIGALLALITFIYAILGMTLFGRAPKKWSVDEVFNFETFLNSSLMLLRLMTAAGWNEVLDSLTVNEPVCGTYRHIKCGLPNEPDCPLRGLVVAYIVSYLVLTYLIVINLYIAIILENYVDACNEEDVGIVEDDLHMFYNRWSYYDPHGTQFIDFKNLPEFLECLDSPFQFKRPNNVAIAAFNLPIARGNKLHCLDVLQALISWVLGQVDDSRDFRKLQSQMEHKFQKQFPTRRLLDIVSSSRRWKIEHNAAIIIQRAWRKYWLRKHPLQDKNHVNGSGVPVEVEQGEHGGMGHMMNRIGNVPKNPPSKAHKSLSNVWAKPKTDKRAPTGISRRKVNT